MNAPQAWATEAGEGCFWVGGVLEGLRGVGGRGHCLQRGLWGETDAPREVALGSPGPLPLHGHQGAASHPPTSCARSFSTDGTLPAQTPTLHGQAGPASGTPSCLRSVSCGPLVSTPSHRAQAPNPGPDGEEVRVKAEPGYLGTKASSHIAQGSHPASVSPRQDGEQSRGQVPRRVPGHQGRHDPVSSPGLWQIQGSLPTSKATKAHPGLAS